MFKRAGVILTVTAWESFIEDAVIRAFDARVESARAPADLQSTFNAVANAWLSQKDRKPPELVRWTLDGWKAVLREQLARNVEALNTPNADNIARVSKCYLGRDVTAEWHWPGVNAATARHRLDALIVLRGRLAHHTRELHERRADVSRRHLARAISLLSRLVQCTEETLGRAPRTHGSPDTIKTQTSRDGSQPKARSA